MQAHPTNCAIVVPSCDFYEDAWHPFFTFFFKNWPDCPFPVYLITEKKGYPDSRVHVLNLGQDYGWANNMKIALDTIPEKYFFYFLEDVFIMKKVDTARIMRLFELLKKDHVSCLRLYPAPGPDRAYGDSKELGIIGENAEYRVSTMPSIWDKEAFKRLLKPGENAWQMELDGTKRAQAMNELFLSVWPKDLAMPIYSTAIKRGHWQYDAVKLCEKEGIKVVTTKPIETFWEYVTRKGSYLPAVGGFFRRGRRWYYASQKKK